MGHYNDLSLTPRTPDDELLDRRDGMLLFAAPVPAFTFTREIRYNRHTHDYDMLLDGEYRGSRASYHQAEVDLDELVSDLLAAGLHRTAGELDAGSDPDEIAADVSWNSYADPAAESDAFDPAPPVDDGPEDNFGGFRAPQLAVSIGS